MSRSLVVTEKLQVVFFILSSIHQKAISCLGNLPRDSNDKDYSKKRCRLTEQSNKEQTFS